jgi:hypothetical protein
MEYNEKNMYDFFRFFLIVLIHVYGMYTKKLMCTGYIPLHIGVKVVRAALLTRWPSLRHKPALGCH